MQSNEVRQAAVSRGVTEGRPAPQRTRVTVTELTFTDYELHVRHTGANTFMYINSLNSYILPFSAKETETQGIPGTLCSKSQRNG